jgi:hypothetical protein
MRQYNCVQGQQHCCQHICPRTQSIGVAARARNTAVYASISSLWRWGLRIPPSIASLGYKLLLLFEPFQELFQ